MASIKYLRKLGGTRREGTYKKFLAKQISFLDNEIDCDHHSLLDFKDNEINL